MTGTPLEAIDGGRAPEGWERLWATDRWPLRELPHNDLHSNMRAGSILFSGFPQPWLKEAAKRWARARVAPLVPVRVAVSTSRAACTS